MKMTSEHYETLKAAMAETLRKLQQIQGCEHVTSGLTFVEYCAANTKCANATMHAAWYLLYHATINGTSGGRWLCDNLYAYINDTHIETALRKIIKEI